METFAHPLIQKHDLKPPPLFAKLYFSLLMFCVGLNGFRVGEVGFGTFAVIFLCIVVAAGVFGSLLFFRIPLSPKELLATTLMLICAIWALIGGDSLLFSSIIIVVSSYIAVSKWAHRPGFLFRYVFWFPFLVGSGFYVLYVVFPSLVYQAEAGGKYIQVGGVTLLRFEGAVLNANAYGIGTSVLMFCLTYLGVRRKEMMLGYLSLVLSASYSGMIGLLYLIGAKLSKGFGRLLCVIAAITILPTYGYVKGWGILESVRIIKYTFYFLNLKYQPLSLILWGGIDRAGHDWVVLSDNAFLTLLYDHGLVFLVVYLLGFFVLLRRTLFLIPLFLFLNFVVDLQYFWFANLMFILTAKMMSRNIWQSDLVGEGRS
ncbi:hypothetical protein ACCD08_07130 [Telluria sp. Tellsp104]